MFGFIFETTNILNGKKYIGKRVYDKKGQWRTYLGSGTLIRKDIKLYGRKNFIRRILVECETEEELNQAEFDEIEKRNAVNDELYYNLVVGGDHGLRGYKYTQDQLNKIGKRIKESYTDEKRKQYSDRMKENNPNADGHVFRGKTFTEEQRKRLSEIQKGHTGLLGDKNPMYGKNGSLNPQYREKSKNARKVKCVDTGEIFFTIIDAGNKYNILPSQISLCCKNINKTAGGLHWEFADSKESKAATEETKKKIASSKMNGNNPMAKAVFCEDTNEIFLSAYEAGRAYNVTGEAISAACKKKNKTCCRMTWRYATQEEVNNFYSNSIAR